jgi:hypothetical protein
MSDWDWFLHFEAQARARGDHQRVRLARFYDAAYACRETDPDRLLALAGEARCLAERLREPWWVLFYDNLRAHALLHFKGDAAAGLELAVANTLEARKPAYTGFPWQFRLHDTLVCAYLYTDPLGHAGPIRAALDYLAGVVPEEGAPKYLLQGRKTWFALERGALDEAAAAVRRSQALAEQDEDQETARYYQVFTCSHWCELAWLCGDGELLAELAAAGEELGRQVGRKLELSEFQMWQALLARRAGRQEQARRLWRQATVRVGRLRMPPDHVYFDALCAYHEEAGERAEALRARDHELSLLTGRGRPAAEVRCRLRRCRLLAELGRLTAEEVAAARAAVGRLRCPEGSLAELEEIGSEHFRGPP